MTLRRNGWKIRRKPRAHDVREAKGRVYFKKDCVSGEQCKVLPSRQGED